MIEEIVVTEGITKFRCSTCHSIYAYNPLVCPHCRMEKARGYIKRLKGAKICKIHETITTDRLQIIVELDNGLVLEIPAMLISEKEKVTT